MIKAVAFKPKDIKSQPSQIVSRSYEVVLVADTGGKAEPGELREGYDRQSDDDADDFGGTHSQFVVGEDPVPVGTGRGAGALPLPFGTATTTRVHDGVLRTRRFDEAEERDLTRLRKNAAYQRLKEGRCSVCNALPPEDPDATHCDVCGTPRPAALHPLEAALNNAVLYPEPGQPASTTNPPLAVYRCPYCSNPVEANARHCYSCNSPLPRPQAHSIDPSSADLRPNTSQHGHQWVECDSCGTTNVAGTGTCVNCEVPLPGTAKASRQHLKAPDSRSPVPGIGLRATPVEVPSDDLHPNTLQPTQHTRPAMLPADTKLGSRVQICRNCDNSMPWDARFCSWCGFKAPLPVQRVIVCQHCGLENLNGARFCNDCGGALPVPQDDRITTGGGNQTAMQQFNITADGTVQLAATEASGDGVARDIVTAASVAPAPRATVTVGVQTGLYFPSARSMEIKAAKSEKRFGKSGRRPRQGKVHDDVNADGPLNETSPGDGYWRTQVAHLAGHIKSYARETPNFQEAIGRPKMGEVTAAQIRENGDEIELTVLFVNRARVGSDRVPETVVFADTTDRSGLEELPRTGDHDQIPRLWRL